MRHGLGTEMKWKLLDQGDEKTFILIFEKGEEAAGGLLDFVKSRNFASGHFTAIGAFSDVTLGYFDRERKEYRPIPVDEQVEVLSLIGDVALEKGAPKVHAH